jgi:hypothetical protein
VDPADTAGQKAHPQHTAAEAAAPAPAAQKGMVFSKFDFSGAEATKKKKAKPTPQQLLQQVRTPGARGQSR